MRVSRFILISPVLLFSSTLYVPAKAKDEGQDKAYYVVEEGDTLWQIATRFGVAIQDLQKANGISDPGQVVIGAQLVIPGLMGFSGQLDTISISYGETLRSSSHQYGLSESALAQLNRLVSPAELLAGSTLIVPVNQGQTSTIVERSSLTLGQSLLELAVLQGDAPWSLSVANNLSSTWSALPKDGLKASSIVPGIGLSGLPEAIKKVDVDPLQMVQGGTTIIKVYAPTGMNIRGSLGKRNLNFFTQDFGYVALQGIHAMTPPGLYALTLEGELPDGKQFAFSQNVLIQDANFPYDPTLEVNPVTVDPAVTEPEKDLWESSAVPVTSEKLWDGIFASPVPADFKECWTSLFGNRRSYNNGAYNSFHSGLDFCGSVGTELYAGAPGKVVFTDTLIVRGGVVVIDHGWGVYTAYDHLSKILVQPGTTVQTGQVIGLGGDTGRTTGPHLHWEVWVGGVQVNPVDWLARSFP
jgi:murein DD-endopeptidase MepM/ murein hydrolase activator NlpD